MIKRLLNVNGACLLAAVVIIMCGCLFCFAEDYQTNICSSVEEAAQYLREAMKERQDSAAVCLITDTAASESEGLINEIFEKALEHTGDPAEGDYLRYQYSSSIASAKPVTVNGEKAVLFTYAITYYDTADQEEAVNDRIEEIIDSLELTDKSDPEKLEAIYDYICENVEYDYDNLEDNENTLKYTAYAALIDGKAVCQGYSSALYRILLEAGVDNRIICGTDSTGTESENDHTWNIVKLGDEYYNADVTKDDELGEKRYYLSGSGLFDEDHLRSEEYNTEEFTESYDISDEDFSSDDSFFSRLGSLIHRAGIILRGLLN